MANRHIRCGECKSVFRSRKAFNLHRRVSRHGDKPITVKQVTTEELKAKVKRQEKQRHLTAVAIKYHPLRHLVGGTMVTEFKGAKSDGVWATRRKRKS